MAGLSGRRVEPERVQPEAADPGPPPGGQQQPVRVDTGSVLQGQGQPVRGAFGLGRGEPSLISAPVRRNAVARISPAKAGSPGSSPGSASTSVTCEPERRVNLRELTSG